MKSILRQAKNTVMQFSDIECKVREATSNDSWGASTSQMAEIAKATNNYQDYPQLFAMLWKRLNDVEHIMHVQKALILVEYLLRNGADRFINDAKRRARDIAQLKKYKHYDANNQDDAKEARAKAKIVYDMLMDDAKLQEERAKALKIKDVRLTGFGSDGGSRYGGQGGDSYGNDSGYGRGSGDYSYGNGNGSTGTVAAPARRRKDSQDEGDPFDDDAPSSAPAKKGAAKDKTAAATTPDGEPVKKKKKKKVPAADAEATESTPEPTKLEAPAADGKKKKKKKKAVVEEKEENGGDDFANPFDNSHSNGQASQAYSAAANSSSFVDEFASAIPIAYQQPQQDIDILTGRAPLSLQTSGDLVDIFSSPTPASPMNQQKLEQIAQQPFDPLGRDPNYRPSPEQKAIEGPKDLWAVSDLMNLNDITKSTAKPAKKIAAAGPTMAELRAKNPGSTDASFSNIGFNNAPAAAAPPMQTPPFQPPMYPNAAPMGYPPLHQQMAGMNMGYPPQPYGYGGMPGYQQPMLALMPPSAYQTGPPALMPPTSSGPSGHADLPFAVTPGSRPAPSYNSSKPVIFEVPSAQQVAQAKVDPHYNYNTQQRVTQRPTSNLASNW